MITISLYLQLYQAHPKHEKPEEHKFWDEVPEELMTEEIDGDGDGSEFMNRHTHNCYSNGTYYYYTISLLVNKFIIMHFFHLQKSTS